ncbi:uncharacterized protein [Temnothorax longispinosus]|uniref:uncharacterized protein n=1 Tax=Temnothorax longispinosus TaxID=300112 RepID=UPI003A997AE7
MFDTKTEKVFKSRDVVFYEDKPENVTEDIIIQEVTDESKDTEDSVGAESNSSDENFESIEDPDSESSDEEDDNNDADRPQSRQEKEKSLVRRSSRVRKPKEFQDFITYSVLEESEQIEPMSVDEALKDPHGREWKQAMKEEYDALIQNQTWELCDRPKDKKVLKTRWIRTNPGC